MQLFLQSLVTQPKLQGCVCVSCFVVWLFRPGIVVSVRIHPRPLWYLCLPLYLRLLWYLCLLLLRPQFLRLCWDLLVPRELILARFLSFVQPPLVGLAAKYTYVTRCVLG